MFAFFNWIWMKWGKKRDRRLEIGYGNWNWKGRGSVGRRDREVRRGHKG
jgi:hypothetical protein